MWPIGVTGSPVHRVTYLMFNVSVVTIAVI